MATESDAAGAVYPEHEIEYDAFAFGLTTTLPDVAFPVENPVPVHTDAFVEVQESVALLPYAIVALFEVRFTVGAGGAMMVIESEPEADVQDPAQVY
jgi:hypothetical protein